MVQLVLAFFATFAVFKARLLFIGPIIAPKLELTFLDFLLQTCVADFASYNASEYPVAKAGVLANIGTNGAKPG